MLSPSGVRCTPNDPGCSDALNSSAALSILDFAAATVAGSAAVRMLLSMSRRTDSASGPYTVASRLKSLDGHSSDTSAT
jgi:hypothetical protein